MADLIERQAVIDTIHKYFFNEIEATPIIETEDGGAYDPVLVNPLLKHNKALCNEIEDLPTAGTDIAQRKIGEWDMFEMITSAWYGKQYYFKEDYGLVYSRLSHKTMPVQDAINEFMKEIAE